MTNIPADMPLGISFDFSSVIEEEDKPPLPSKEYYLEARRRFSEGDGDLDIYLS
jgi:hypothetical protein